MEIFEEAGRKRPAPGPTAGADQIKRRKLAPQQATKVQVRPLPPGQHTLADVFTVTEDPGLKTFDVGQIGEDLVVKIGISLLQRIDSETLEQTIEV